MGRSAEAWQDQQDQQGRDDSECMFCQQVQSKQEQESGKRRKNTLPQGV